MQKRNTHPRYLELQFLIKKKYGSIKNFAADIPTTKSCVYTRLYGKTEFKVGDILRWQELLGFSDEDIIRLFFVCEKRE